MTETMALIFDRMLVENEWMLRVKRQINALLEDDPGDTAKVLLDMDEKWAKLFAERTAFYKSLTDKPPQSETLDARLVWMTEIHGDVMDKGDLENLSDTLPPILREENALICAVLYAMRPIMPPDPHTEKEALGLLFFQTSQLVSLRMGLYSDLRRQLRRSPAAQAPVVPLKSPALWEYRFMIRMHDDIFSTEKPKEKTPE